MQAPRNAPARLVRTTAAAAVACLAACAGHSSVERGADHFAGGVAASLDGAVTDLREYAIPVDGILDVDVQTFAGDVVVRGGRDTGGEARIRVLLTARHGRERKEEAQASIDDIQVQAEVRRGGDVPTLVMRCTSAHDEAWLHDTDIEIDLPELRRARVRTRDGKVYVFENRGGCSVETVDGEVRMFTPWAISEDVSLVTRGGQVVMRAFTGTCGTFDVECVNGDVKTRIEAGDWRILDRRNDHDTLRATLGTCQNRIMIRNVDAPVRISIVKDPMDYGSIFSSP
jgi:hypothetical protein